MLREKYTTAMGCRGSRPNGYWQQMCRPNVYCQQMCRSIRCCCYSLAESLQEYFVTYRLIIIACTHVDRITRHHNRFVRNVGYLQ